MRFVARYAGNLTLSRVLILFAEFDRALRGRSDHTIDESEQVGLGEDRKSSRCCPARRGDPLSENGRVFTRATE